MVFNIQLTISLTPICILYSYVYNTFLLCLFIDNGYNLPKVVHCTDQLQKFVYSKKDISKIPLSKNLPELVRRFVEDAYLCIYTANNTV